MNRSELLFKLKKLGFQQFLTRVSTYKYAMFATNDSQTMYILVRARGIDVILYDELVLPKLDKNNKLYVTSDSLVRNYYNNSRVNLHYWILEIASKFISNESLSKKHMTGQGSK